MTEYNAGLKQRFPTKKSARFPEFNPRVKSFVVLTAVFLATGVQTVPVTITQI